jgi:hypothetical protein
MKIEMRCPNGHRVVYEDDRFRIPDSQKIDFWLSKGNHCTQCDEVLVEGVELLDVHVNVEVVSQ